MQVEGDLTLNLKGLVPRLILGKATKVVENLSPSGGSPIQKTTQALTDFLRATNS